MEGAKAIAAVLKDSQLSTLGCAATPNLYLACTQCQAPRTSSPPCSRSLAGNGLCGVWTKYGQQKGTYTAEGITALCEGLKGSAVTSLT